MYRCPACGGAKLVWDHMSGYVVCSLCGTVVDVIYHEGPGREEAGQYWTGEPAGGAPRHSHAPASKRRSVQAIIASPEPINNHEEVAVSVYMAALKAGLPARRALRLARKASGLSVRSIKSALARYKA